MEHNWDYYFGFVGQADYYRPRITEGVRGKYEPAKLYEGEYVDTLLTRKAVEWLKQKRDQAVLHVSVVLCAACAVLPAKRPGQRPQWRAHTQARNL